MCQLSCVTFLCLFCGSAYIYNCERIIFIEINLSNFNMSLQDDYIPYPRIEDVSHFS